MTVLFSCSFLVASEGDGSSGDRSSGDGLLNLAQLYGLRYLTLSRNGVLRMFSMQCEPLEVFRLKGFHGKSYAGLIASDMVYMSNIGLLAVCFAHR
mgnify:CR=1 FL=1